MVIAGRLGNCQTPKERLAVAIIDVLRLVAPEASYRFRTLANQNYQLVLNLGITSTELHFTADDAQMADTADGQAAIRAHIVARLYQLTRNPQL